MKKLLALVVALALAASLVAIPALAEDTIKIGGIGCTTGLAPALTLGCGAVGGSATSENVSPMLLLNQRYVAYGLKEMEDVRKGIPTCGDAPCAATGAVSADQVEDIVKQVLAKLQAF